ncbi:MAG TPA: NfeD family protein [Acidimicrobiales bacterium]|nr:NfeD family protein [Acidimicrobiales bacterium]
MGLVWLVGAVLVLLLAGASLAGAHAGGHALVAPFVSLSFLGAWLAAAASRGPTTALAWAMAGVAAGTSLVGAALALPALRYRKLEVRTGPTPPPGAAGVAVTSLSPTGVVRVAGETWTAASVSGVVPEGAPVHVIGVRGVGLTVWSELGSVPGPESLPGEENRWSSAQS